MADTFNPDDFLNSGGEQQVQEEKKEEKTLVEISRGLGEKLKQHLTDEELQEIYNANHHTIKKRKQFTEKSVRALIKELSDFEKDELMSVLTDFSVLNEQEQGIIDAVNNHQIRLEGDLKELEATSDSWWNRTFRGRSRKLKDLQSQLALIPSQLEKAKGQANDMRDKRIDEAVMNELLKELNFKTESVITEIVRQKKDASEAKEIERQFLKNAQEVLFKAATKLKTVKEELGLEQSKLRQAENSLTNYEAGSPPYITQQNLISDIKQKVEALKGDEKAAQAISDSKENFVKKHEVTIKTLTAQISNMNAIMAKLGSDTKERHPFYKSYVQALKLSATEEYAAILEELGEQTDQMVVHDLLTMYNASQNNVFRMLKKHAGRQDKYHEFLTILAQQAAKFEEQTRELDEIRESGYHLDVEDTFTQSHKNEADEKVKDVREQISKEVEEKADTEGSDDGRFNEDDFLN